MYLKCAVSKRWNQNIWTAKIQANTKYLNTNAVKQPPGTYKTNLLRDLDLGDYTSSDIICKACGVTNAEGVGA